MRLLKRDRWRVVVPLAGLILILLLVLIPLSVSAYGRTPSVVIARTAQPTPTVDLTVTALAKEQLTLQVKQLQENSDRGFDAWLWNNAAAIVASFLSTLIVVVGALIGFWQWRTNRNDIRTKETSDRKEAQGKELRERAEERFKAAVTALGSDNKTTQVGGAILLRSFLNREDKEIYGRYYDQVFDLSVAYLRPSGTSKPSKHLNTPTPLTPLRRALSIVFLESFALAREDLGPTESARQTHSLDASDIIIDEVFFTEADLRHIWMLRASFRNVTFIGADLRGAFLHNANFHESTFLQAHFNGATLVGADFTDADLREAGFRSAILSGADLSNADFTNADLTGADLTGAILKDTKLNEVKGLTREELEDCKARGAIINKRITVSTTMSTAVPPNQSNHVQPPAVPPAQATTPPVSTME